MRLSEGKRLLSSGERDIILQLWEEQEKAQKPWVMPFICGIFVVSVLILNVLMYGLGGTTAMFQTCLPLELFCIGILGWTLFCLLILRKRVAAGTLMVREAVYIGPVKKYVKEFEIVKKGKRRRISRTVTMLPTLSPGSKVILAFVYGMIWVYPARQ